MHGRLAIVPTRLEPIDPRHAAAHTNLGLALFNHGEPDAAIAEYRLALEIEPRSARSHNHLAIALEDKGDAAGAVAEYEQALAIDPRIRDAERLENLGEEEQRACRKLWLEVDALLKRATADP